MTAGRAFLAIYWKKNPLIFPRKCRTIKAQAVRRSEREAGGATSQGPAAEHRPRSGVFSVWAGKASGRMKKYGWLAVITAALIVGIRLAGAAVRVEPVTVTAYTVKSQAVEKTVSCSGKIEAVESQKVYADTACIAQDVYVQAGQEVKKGDLLFTVDVEATRQALASLGGSSVSGQVPENLENEVTAPVAGVVTSLNVESGGLVDASNPCVEIAPDSSLQVKVAIHERDLKKVKVGQAVKVSGVAFEKQTYHGVVKSIATSARQQLNGTVSETVVDAVISLQADELDESLRLGLTAKARVVVDEAQDTVVVPYGCVLQDEENREYVYRIENGAAVKQVIVTGEELTAGFQVTEGLQPGDVIASNPDVIPEEGTPVVYK